MKIIIGRHGCTIQWDGVYYFSLTRYPDITPWELRNLVLTATYEKVHNRETIIECADVSIKHTINYALLHPESVLSTKRPKLIPAHPDCANCKQGGCATDLVCHTASVENAKSIFSCGCILSATKARNLPCTELAAEKRNAAGDPSDYFEYAMLAWGNCQAGDRLVMERLLGRSPDQYELSAGFRPGVRFFFEYDKMIHHPDAVLDGYHPVKIKDGIRLDEYLLACVIPANFKNEFEHIVSDELKERIHYVKNDCPDIWNWSSKVFHFVDDFFV